MNSLERQKRFNAFKQDLEARLALYLFKHPETEQKQIPAGKMNIEVKESYYNAGTWCVWVDGKCISLFIGPDAQKRATKAAGDAANGQVS